MKLLAGLVTLCLVGPLAACQHDADAGPRTSAGSGSSVIAEVPPVGNHTALQARPSALMAACASAIGRLEAALVQEAPYLIDPKTDPTMKQWFGRTMSVLRESCEQDQWPTSLISCMSSARDLASLTSKCTQQTSPELQRRMQDRMTRALKDMTLASPPGAPASKTP